MNRREFLVSLATLPLLADSGGVAIAANISADPSADAVRAARVLTGRNGLPEAVITRAVTLLTTAKPQFRTRLAALAKAIGNAAPEQRDEVIASLSDADAATAIELVAPLYLGFTGTPSTIRAMDDAQFVTFRDALMYEPTADNLIRPSYARGGADYWVEPPAGVTPPPMDPDILEWGTKSPKAASTYATPDPRYLAICQGHVRTLAEAEQWLAEGNASSGESHE